MNAVDAWCDREARRAARRPSLAEALVSGRTWRYAAHRTRFLLLRVPVRVGLHLAEVILLGFLFPVEELGPIFAVRAVMSIAAALHWGALEALREEVRAHARRRAWTKATEAIRTWLLRSVDVGLGQLAVAVLWVWLGPSEFKSFSIFDAYALCAGIRLLLETVARTYAAGIGALRRVPRPLWAALPGDVLDLCGALLVWPFAGAWGFAGALLAAGMLRSFLVVFYARRAYRVSPLRAVRFQAPRRRLARIAPDAKKQAARAALGNATSQLDAWILLALTVSAQTEQDAFVVAAIHVLRPLLSASTGWARLFYLDLKQLEVKGRLLQARLESFLRRFALLVALVTSALLLFLWPLLWGRAPDATALWLLPFLLVRSLFALYQVQAFSYGRMGYLLSTAAGVGAGLLALVLVPVLRAHALSALTLWLGALLVLARAPRGSLRPSDGEVVGLYRWLSLVAASPVRGRVVSAVVEGRVSVPVRRIAARIARQHGGVMTIWGRRNLVWFEEASGSASDAGRELAVLGGGCVADLRRGPVGGSGREALARAIDHGTLEPHLAARLKAARHVPPAELVAEFKAAFAGGSVLEPKRGRLDLGPSGLGRTSVAARRALAEVFRASGGPGGRPARGAPGHLFVLAPGGEPDVVFVAPPASDVTQRAAWRRRIEDATLAASRAGP